MEKGKINWNVRNLLIALCILAGNKMIPFKANNRVIVVEYILIILINPKIMLGN